MRAGAVAVGLAPDPVVPARDVLLDPDQVAAILRRAVGRRPTIEHCALRRVKYRIGESLRVVYDVAANGHNVVMSARTFEDSRAAYDKATDAEPVHGLPGVSHDPQTGSVWWVVPNDRRLRNLGTLLDAPLRVRQASGVDWEHSTLIEYAPERSATARLTDGQGQVTGFAKAYRDRDALEVAEQYNRVAASVALIDGIRTPRALGWARPDRIVVLEPMPGRVWTQLPVESQVSAMQRFGAALAHVHGLPNDFGRGRFQRYRPDRIEHSADLVAIARPDVADAAHTVRDRLAGGPPPAEAVCLHGDVHANNVLFHADQVHVIDFDQGGSGAAAADLGSMLASLTTARLIDRHAIGEGLGNAFLAGYKSVRPLPHAAELRWYTAAAFVAERAIRAVNRINQPALHVLPELFHAAEETLDGRMTLGG